MQDHDFYDFEAKYLDDGDVRLTCPADVPRRVADDIQEMAARAFEAAGLRGARAGRLLLTDDGRCLINEVNTMPGFTPNSMYPRMWAATGLQYAELIDELVALALERRTGLR